MTKEDNKWQALVDELRAEGGNAGMQQAFEYAANRIEALMAEMCDVALEGCVDYEAYAAIGEPCDTHGTLDTSDGKNWKMQWGKFTDTSEVSSDE
jgi:hypothetical protein